MSRYITEAVVEKLKKKKLSLDDQYKLAALDEDSNREFNEWSIAMGGDGLNERSIHGLVLKIKVIPKASKSEVAGWEGEELRIRLKAVPEKGQANDELIKFLSKFLGISKSQITLLRGDTSRHKQMQLDGISLAQLTSKIDVV